VEKPGKKDCYLASSYVYWISLLKLEVPSRALLSHFFLKQHPKKNIVLYTCSSWNYCKY